MNKHIIKLPPAQAAWWHDFCLDLGFRVDLSRNTQNVTVWGEQKEIEAAWDLFCKEFDRKMAP